MNDETVQRKLNQLTKLANELHSEAQSRYGEEGCLFYESGGVFNFMEHDRMGVDDARTDGIRKESNGVCNMACGSW